MEGAKGRKEEQEREGDGGMIIGIRKDLVRGKRRY